MITLVPPGFWYRNKPSLEAALLTPLSWLWLATAYMRRASARPYTSRLPVICVGNAMIGGTGKTPAAIAILKATGSTNACFLMRGYRGSTREAVLVREGDAAAHGDEAVLLSRHAPVIVAADRVAGLQLAEQSGFDLVIADDGFQNPHFTKTSSVLVFDGGVGIGNGACIPAGPLRETLDGALARANAVIIVGDDETELRARLSGTPVFSARFEPTTHADGPYVAFAGIGRPAKFFDTLHAGGYTIVETVPFPDHHVYTDDDLAKLQALAARHKARLITTEKDHVRLPKAADVDVLPVTLVIDDVAALATLLRRA